MKEKSSLKQDGRPFSSTVTLATTSSAPTPTPAITGSITDISHLDIHSLPYHISQTAASISEVDLRALAATSDSTWRRAVPDTACHHREAQCSHRKGEPKPAFVCPRLPSPSRPEPAPDTSITMPTPKNASHPSTRSSSPSASPNEVTTLLPPPTRSGHSSGAHSPAARSHAGSSFTFRQNRDRDAAGTAGSGTGHARKGSVGGRSVSMAGSVRGHGTIPRDRGPIDQVPRASKLGQRVCLQQSSLSAALNAPRHSRNG